MSDTLWRRIRQLVQFLVLLLFLYLFVSAKGGQGVPLNLLSRFDPLLAIGAMLASRQLIPTLLPALVTVAVTLLVGRVWCGWICPLGTVLDLYGPRGRRGLPARLRQAKYYILFTILFLAVLGSLAFMYLDPITIFIRGLAGAVYPLAARVPVIGPALQSAAAANVAPAHLSLAMALPLLLILLLNFIERRFWCRYLCPLGGLIGLLSRWSWLKRSVRQEGRQPCRLDCPAGTNVTGFVALISTGRFQQAVDLIREGNPLTTVCGHVCPHPCESDCNRQHCDQAVAINSLERFVGDYARQHGSTSVRPTPIGRAQKVAVIGAGPAGLTAAYRLRRLGYAVKVYEQLPVPGGMLAAGIPRYRLPREVLQGDIDFIRQQGVEIECGAAVDAARLAELRQAYDALFIAVGAHSSRRLGVPGEDLAGVIHGVDFLRELNLNERAEIGSQVAVIGGGDVAIDAARCARRLGAEVTLFYRRSRQEMPARAEEIQEAEEEGVKFHFLATPTRLIGENGRLVGMECIRLELGAPDESGRARPVPVAGSEFTVPVATVIPAIGQYTAADWLAGSGLVTAGGRLEVDGAGMTSVPGLFAGGDAVSGPATVTEAVGAGGQAALAIDRYLQGVAPAVEAQPPRRIPFEELPPTRTPQKQERPAVATLASEARQQSFDQVRLGLSREQALAEARRCLNWNCAECTICAQVCPMGAIEPQDLSSHPSECTVCLDCLAACPAGAGAFQGGWAASPRAEYDPSRRQFLASAATAAAGFGLLQAGVGRNSYPFLLRPPGAAEEPFLSQCVRCGQCIQVCPNSALKMAVLEGGWEKLWTPILVPRSGHCSYDCNACGQVCPSQAIPPLSLERKRQAVIGLAHVDRERCISCLLCLDTCPTEALEAIAVDGANYPQVVPGRCIGCGTCEHTCPIEGESAIRVYAPGFQPAHSVPYVAPTPTSVPAPGETVTPEPTEAPAAHEPSDKRAYVHRSECIRCMICVKECEQGAIVEVEDEEDTKWPLVDVELCIGCGICEEKCPRDPKAIKLYDPDELPGG